MLALHSPCTYVASAEHGCDRPLIQRCAGRMICTARRSISRDGQTFPTFTAASRGLLSSSAPVTTADGRMPFGHILKESSPGFITLTLSRPEVHNAFCDRSIASLVDTLSELEKRTDLRALFLRGEGTSFCAGADLGWMRRAANYTKEESHADALVLSGMLHRLASLPFATIALVHGNAFGGGVGLIAACDMAVGVRNAKLALSEARLGLIPATISPYVLRRIGGAQARRFFLTAERFEATQAEQIGLLNKVVDDVETMEAWALKIEKALRECAPSAVRAGKELISTVEGKPITPDLLDETAHLLALQRTSEEGREGVSAFLEKRPPFWASKE